jgi:hypothetical protein
VGRRPMIPLSKIKLLLPDIEWVTHSMFVRPVLSLLK